MLKRTVTIIFALMLTVSMLAVPQASAAGTTTSGNDSSAFTLRASRSGNTVKLSWDKYSGAKWYYLYYVNEDNSTALICRTARTSFTDTDKSTDAGKTVKIDNNSNYKYV
ncbi:MAG: hypothetical protein VZQ84_04030, partial [Anaerovoracaceae bacterium]|nr:hypothetical protein [Anaerovoracaceae bacterium]